MQHQCTENSETLEDLSEKLASNDSGKMKKRRHKDRTDNAENPQPDQKSEKRRNRCHESSSAEKQEKECLMVIQHGAIRHSANKHVRAKHPDMPKQPASVYVRFMLDYRRKLLQKNPMLKPAEIFVEVGKKYQQLRDGDKAKYVNEFLLETKNYNIAIQNFLEQHPEHRNSWAGGMRNNLEKRKSGSVEIISGKQLYINKRTQEHLETDVDSSSRSIMAIYRKKWKEDVDEQEKVMYILEAKRLNATYAESVTGSKTKDSDHDEEITSSNFNEIEEQFLQEQLVPPPFNGYQLFIKENANAELPFGEVNRKWKKELSQEERNSYTIRAKLTREKFKKDLAEYEKKEEAKAEFHSLPLRKKLRNTLKEEHKFLVSFRKQLLEKPKKITGIKEGRPPLNGRLLFTKEQMSTVKDLDFKLRFAELNSRWKNQLSQEERDDYSARAKAEYDKFMEEHP